MRKRMMKTIFVEDEDTAVQIDIMLSSMHAVGADIDFDIDWEEVPEEEEEEGIGHARLTPQEAYDHDNPPLRDDPMEYER